MTARPLGVLAAITVVAAAVVVSSAHAALFFVFTPTTGDAGDLVTVRLGGTPPSFTLADRERPFDRPMRLYLVPNGVAASVRSRFDPRLHFIGALVPDRNSRGVLQFRVPPLDTAKYAVAAWCPGCARFSRGRAFFELGVTEYTESRFPAMVLRVRMPSASKTCPITRGTYDNGFFSMPGARQGVLLTQRDLGQKLPWVPREGFTGALFVRGERLDAPSPAVTAVGKWGYSSDGRGGWASAVRFPSEGCWRLTGRVADLALSFVVRVVRG